MSSHAFGGSWTRIKLEALENYLSFYTTALKNQNFNLLYIDAFAGTGECEIKTEYGTRVIRGSAQIALDKAQSFYKLIFIDDKKKHVKQLKALCADYSNVEIHYTDANQKVIELCQTIDWKRHRAVMFLDPYGLDVNWITLKAIASTQAIDVCFLFSLSGLFRQAARDMKKVDEAKARALDNCLGTTEWREVFYTRTGQQDLFDGEQAPVREVGVPEMEKYVKSRLETIFSAVSEPMRLPKTGAPLFSLFIAVSNPSPKATGLAMKLAKHIFNKS